MKIQRTLLSFMSIFFISILLPLFSAEAHGGGKGVQWMTNYEKALALSKSTSRPIILFFTGSDWCGWCNKLEKEVFDTPEFTHSVGDKLIFVKLDYPMHKKLEPALAQQNELLQKKFSVRSYPTIILIDPDQQPLGITGYRSGGGNQYAQHLMKMVNEYTAYKHQVKRLGSHNFSGKELKRLYQKAHELGLQNDQNLLIRIGMESDLDHFFVAERYRYLVDQGQPHSTEAAALKQRLRIIDPDNTHLSHYQIAVIDFEACCEESQTASLSPEETVSPLLKYIEEYGEMDKENLWRLNMVVSQVYLDNNRLAEALRFAQASYSSAPSSIQPEIALAVKNIQKQMSSED